jgi:hypothetical protein
MKEPGFRDYRLLLDEQTEQIFAITMMSKRGRRKIGGTRKNNNEESVAQ